MSQTDATNRQDTTLVADADRRKDSSASACAALRFLSDQLAYAVLIAARDSRLLHANSSGWQLLSGDSPFCLNRGVLLVQGVSGALWTDGMDLSPKHARCKVIQHRPARLRQIVDYRVAVTQAALNRAGDPIVFCVYTQLSQRQIDAAVLRSLYDLTPAEAATAVGIFGGCSLAELARERATSIHTVRTQLKRVLHKCQVRSQLELCRLLATGPGVF